MQTTVFDELWEDLTTPQQQAVARGDWDLDALIESLTADTSDELCPRCCIRTVALKSSGRVMGLCSICARDELTRRYEDRISELEALRDANRRKKQIQRLRDEIDPDRPRRGGPSAKRARDYGRSEMIPTSEHRSLTYCDRCGRTMVRHEEGESTCTYCLNRQ